MTNVNNVTFYRYDPDANSFRGIALRENDYDLVSIHSKFERVAEKWKEIVVEELEDSPAELGDFPSLVDRRRIPLFSQKAWDAFGPYISDIAEALPVMTTKGNRLFVIHVHRPTKTLFSDRCEFDRFSDGGVRRINKFCFDQSKNDYVTMMKLPPELGGDLIVSNEFRRIVERNSLEGLNFPEVPQVD